MSTLFQWIHVSAAVIGVGGMAFILFILLPASRILNPEWRQPLLNAVSDRFRWVTWTAIVLLIGSGVYNASLAWEAPWGRYWWWLTVKIALAAVVFLIVLCLSIPLKALASFRQRQRLWLGLAFGLGVAVILISAYLRRG